jgi:hypothetical protein
MSLSLARSDSKGGRPETNARAERAASELASGVFDEDQCEGKAHLWGGTTTLIA